MKMFHYRDLFFSLLKDKYGEEKAEKLFAIHGFDRLDTFEFRNRLIGDGILKHTIDPNANLSDRPSYGKLFSETYKPLEKLWSFATLYERLKKLFGEAEAKKCLLYILDGSLYFHDATKLTYYCASIESLNLLLNGRTWGRTHSKPPRHVHSFLGQLLETIINMSQEQSGALAISDFFIILTYLWDKDRGSLLTRSFHYKKPVPSVAHEMQNLLQSFCFALNNECRVSGESPFTNLSLFDKPRLDVILDNYRALFNFETEKEKQAYIRLVMYLQELYMKMKSSEEPPLTFPIDTVNLTVDENGEILDKQMLDLLVKYNTKSYRFNIYLSHPDDFKLQMCCRLSLDLLKERQKCAGLRYGIDSYGNSLFSVASHRVVTINPVRIALLTKDSKQFLKLFEDRLETARHILLAHRSLLSDWIKRDMFIAYTHGYLRLENTFSTFGLIGLYEAMDLLGFTTSKEKYVTAVQTLLDFVEDYIVDFIKKDGYLYNVECVPGESCANTLALIDNILFGYKPHKHLMLYSNQFVPLWKEVNFLEKVEIESALIHKLSGGAICFIQVGSELTEEQMSNLIKYCAKQGLRHFCINPVLSVCENKHTSFGRLEKCPKCGAEIVDYVSRIVGYFTVLKNFGRERQKEFFLRKNVL